MSRQTPTFPERWENNENLNNTESQLSKFEKNILDKYHILSSTLRELTEFITIKKSQEKLVNLRDFIQNSNISESEKDSLNKVSEDSFQEFAHDVFSQLELSKNRLSQLDSYIHWEKNEHIASSKNNSLFISDARYTRACNPTKPHHHVDGCIAGISHSVWVFTKETIGLLIDTGKAFTIDGYRVLTDDDYSTNAFKNI